MPELPNSEVVKIVKAYPQVKQTLGGEIFTRGLLLGGSASARNGASVRDRASARARARARAIDSDRHL